MLSTSLRFFVDENRININEECDLKAKDEDTAVNLRLLILFDFSFFPAYWEPQFIVVVNVAEEKQFQ